MFSHLAFPNNTEWTLAGSLAWLMFDDDELAQAITDSKDSAAYLAVLTLNPLSEQPAKKSFNDAVDELLRLVKHGALRCKAVRGRSSGREIIETEDWIGRKFIFDPDGAVERLSQSNRSLVWCDLIFFNAKGDAVITTEEGSLGNNQTPRKAQILKLHKSWRIEYEQIKAKNPNKSDTWIAKQISKLDIAKGRSDETIRKNMKSRKLGEKCRPT